MLRCSSSTPTAPRPVPPRARLPGAGSRRQRRRGAFSRRLDAGLVPSSPPVSPRADVTRRGRLYLASRSADIEGNQVGADLLKGVLGGEDLAELFEVGEHQRSRA